MKDIYILQSQPIIIDGVLCNDLIYIDKENIDSPLTNELKCIRIKNIIVNFLCARPPGMTLREFLDLAEDVKQKVESDTNPVEIKHVQKYDSQLFTFENKLDYIEFSTNNPWELRKCYELLKTELIRYYHKLNPDSLKGFDKIFYNQTESPFRDVQFTTDINKINYYLSCNYSIPCVGPISIDVSALLRKTILPTEHLIINRLHELDFKDIPKTFHKTESSDPSLYNSIKTMSYDIETYNKGVITLDPKDEKQPIICIGFAVFKFGDIKPLKRFCVISKDFSEEELKEFEYTVDQTYINGVQAKLYNIKDYKEANDNTSYIIVKDEPSILKVFIGWINKVKPYFISGFNNWTFDDKWVESKCEQYKLVNDINKSLNIYKGTSKEYPITKFMSLSVKLDNEVIKGGPKSEKYVTWKNCFTVMHDTMFSALKEDPKRFSNRTRKNLDTMLEVYNILNPYDNSQLSKTGLSIITMFDYWQHDTHIYEIAKYCCQDAWITGTFAIKRNMYGDFIEMSNMTNTTTQDSVYKAVNVRVGNTIAKYAHDEDYALFDVPEKDTRNRRVKPLMGNKYYDKRTLIGGMVRNKRNGREKFIVALDFSSMYPSQKEGSNVDTSSRVDDSIIINPEEFNLTLLDKYFIEDMYGSRWFYTFKNNSNGNIYKVEQFFTEFKLDKKMIMEIKEEYREVNKKIANNIKEPYLKSLEQLLLERFKNEINPYHRQSKLSLKELILSNVPIPNTIKYPLYFCQSPKDKITDLPTIHYSIKEKLLSDFRAKRVEVKNDMKKTKDPTVKIQLSAKEKAIKVVMNSEYGQTGSDLFAHYDSDIGGAVTYGSRSCIMELTSCLFSNHFYVPESYLHNKYLLELINPRNSRKEAIAKIEKKKYKGNWKLALEGSNRSVSECVEILKLHTKCPEKFENVVTRGDLRNVLDSLSKDELSSYIEGKDRISSPYEKRSDNIFNRIDFDLPPRRITSADLYFELREKYIKGEDLGEIYVITLPQSQLIYQDTDSNYYTNDSIVTMYPELNPSTINEIMTDLISHNNLLSNLIPEIIHRKPIGVGFEGAFVVARYLNKKKKYYGKKWSSSMKDYIEITREPGYILNSYEKKWLTESKSDIKVISDESKLLEPIKIKYDWKHLPDDYETFLDSSSGDVMGNYNSYYSSIPYKDGSYFNAKPELIGDKDFIDYVNQCGIKCTGVDLARRDQYKFINYNHVLIIKNDMKYVNIENSGEFNCDMLNVANEVCMNGKVSKVGEEESTSTQAHKLTPVIEKLIDDFKNISVIEHEYPVNYYAKFKVYKDNKSEVKPIVENFINFLKDRVRRDNKGVSGERLDELIKEESLYKHMPEIGQRVSYIILDKDNENVINSGLIPITKKDCVKDKACLVPVAMEYFGRNTKKQENYLPEDYFNNDVLDVLDYKDYFSHLVTSLTTYMIIERDPSIARYLDDDWKLQQNESEKELEEMMNKEINKIKNRIKNEIMKKYYGNETKIVGASNKNIKTTHSKNIMMKIDNQLGMKIYDLEQLLIKDSKVCSRIINNRNIDVINILHQLDIKDIETNINVLNVELDKLSKKRNSVETMTKIMDLLTLYDCLIGMIYENNPSKFEGDYIVKISLNEVTKTGVVKLNIRFVTDSIGATDNKFKDSKKDLLMYNNKISRSLISSYKSFERFICTHIESCSFSSKYDIMKVNVKDYEKLLNLLEFMFIRD